MKHLINDLQRHAKWSFAARRIPLRAVMGIDEQPHRAVAGQLVLGRVQSVGQHRRIQLASGRHATLYPGDLIVMPCGARYAPDQFEGLAEIGPESCDMLAGGGCLGRAIASHEKMKTPTRVQPLGRLLGAGDRVLSTADFALPAGANAPLLPVIAVVGTAMNSGKTTAAVALTKGLTLAGWQVAAVKATGTGSFGDFNEYLDTGARYVGDFTDAGMVTTYLEPLSRIKSGILSLAAAAREAGAEIMVMEIADGLFQQETAALLADAETRSWFSGVLFACGDGVAALGGVAELARNGLHPLALTGLLSCSPMLSREAEGATGLSVVTRAQLLDPQAADALVRQATRGVRAA
ncbi:DUF1611 domain-containing protein [Paracoccus laeviglucosivorans]|uniref:Uncharacterized protein n=1 Tax=Paracoccus laeviglucosivorans TaxID=1197861 RepID=A0A521BB69_9RHOB|nr:DUF1611 domain-containing protein [Paracoccus laeviglucosivorans]SMO43980.1 Protein of unknown function [Paracoccus laeviglucosivorans]